MESIVKRRAFLGMAALAGFGWPAAAQIGPAVRDRNGLLHFVDDKPLVDFRSGIDRPIKLASAEVLVVGTRNHQFVRVRSTDGDEGIIKANSRMEEVISLFRQIAVPAFSNVDLRDLETIIPAVYRAQYKFAGLAFWTAIGHLELAVWDMLGKAAGKRCVEFMGPVLREEIPIYVSSLDRKSAPEQEIEAIRKAVAETGATGCKIKAGGRLSRNVDAYPGRTEALIPAVRKAFGDDFTIYVDANGSYDAPAAIELCRMLEDHGVDMLEEPCPHEDVEMTRQVVKRTKLKIAGGEQDGSMERWRWYIENRALDVLQPDFMYNGGMLRTLFVQRMADKAGVPVAPHYPRNGVETVELLHFAAQARNLYGLQEYRMNPRVLDFDHSPVIAPKDGKLKLPDGPGFGATFDPKLWDKAVRL
jgi:D-galactarolactone cycloisomerase